MIAGVFIEERKRATFKRVLNEEGFSYTEHPGLLAGTVLLRVECKSAEELALVIRRAQRESRH